MAPIRVFMTALHRLEITLLSLALVLGLNYLQVTPYLVQIQFITPLSRRASCAPTFGAQDEEAEGGGGGELARLDKGVIKGRPGGPIPWSAG